MPFIDSHCHLTSREFDGRIDEVLAAMRERGVAQAVCICTRMEEFERVHALARAHPEIWATVGVHPDLDPAPDAIEPTVEDLVACAGRPRVVGIGETGLDYYRLNGRTVAQMQFQRDRFARHIAAALATDLPIIVHTRAASADTLDLLRSEGRGRLRGVLHCFTETADVARQVLDLGLSISLSGIVSFRNAEPLREVARLVPAERLLIETDSPYLAPVPHRGRTNQPAWVADVAQAVADARGESLETVAAVTTANFHRLFDRAAPAPA